MSKNIIISSDGTWNKFEDGSKKNTNVGLFDNALEIIPDKQVKFYDKGVGTGLGKYIGGATGLGISQNIKDCYGYLVENYVEGDTIFLFGFSRGAYTVRSLCGLIHRCGILRKAEKNKIDEAYNCYRDIKFEAQQTIKNNYAIKGNIHMIGVWDTVGALGIPVNWLNRFNPLFHEFHDTQLNPYVKFAYHALAIDEARKNFSPTLWDEPVAPGQTIEQVWFSGAHSDVGGGYPERGLADITLEWMIVKAIKQGLKFKAGYEHLAHVDSHAYLHDPREGVGAIYRKQLRQINANRQANVYPTVAERINSNKNIPIPIYAPQNLLGLENLAQHYVMAGKESINA